MWRRWGFFRQFKLNVIRLARLRSEPDDIARGMALGLFVGFTPTFGIQMLLALLFAFLLRQNKIAAVIGVWVTNPVTAPFIYGLEYQVGRLLLGLSPHYGQLPQLPYELSWTMGMQIIGPILIGNLVLGLPVAIIGYSLTVRFIPVLRQFKFERWPRRRDKGS